MDILDENDVPGASLKYARLDDHSVSELKRWLACRNLPVRGVKNVLIKRIQNCISSGQSKKLFVGIDNGIWYQQKISGTSSQSQTPVLYSSNLTDLSWKKFPSVSIPRSFSLTLINEWMQQAEVTSYHSSSSDSDRENVDQYVDTGDNSKALRRGRLSFKSGHVSDIKDSEDNEFYYLKASVMASYKKVLYKTYMCLNKQSSRIVDAACECKAGAGRSCSHVAALLFCLEDYTLIYNFEPPSSTSVLKTWNMGRKMRNNPQSVLEAEYISPHGELKENRKRFLMFHPSRQAGNRSVQAEDPNVKLLRLLNTKGLNSSYGHLITIKYEDYDIDDLVLKSLFERVSFVKNALYEECNDIFEKCNEQNTEKWHMHRRMFITASEVKRFVTARQYKNIIYNKLWASDKEKVLEYLPAIRWGREKEGCAFAQYKQTYNADIEKCGFIINKKIPGVGCSPDGLVFKNGVLDGMIEIKCPYSLKDNYPTDIAGKDQCYIVDDNGNMKIKESHQYFFQIQTSMSVLNIDWCDFIVWTPKGMLVQKVVKKPDFDEVLKKISGIHEGVLLPELSQTYWKINHVSAA